MPQGPTLGPGAAIAACLRGAVGGQSALLTCLGAWQDLHMSMIKNLRCWTRPSAAALLSLAHILIDSSTKLVHPASGIFPRIIDQ